MKKRSLLNWVLSSIVLILSIMLLIGGVFRVSAWLIIKFALPAVGVLGFILFLISKFFRKKRYTSMQTALTILLCCICIFPFFILMNIVSIAYPANINKVKPAVTVKWPFKEETIVGWGGDNMKNNLPHAMWGSERWAYDLVMEPHNTQNPDLASYGIWDKEVFSPVEGEVVAIQNNDNDILPNQDKIETLEGNYVYIKIDQTKTFLLLNHLKKGSVAVAVGDKVKAGDFLARIGNSGSTSEPHLHIHHQRQDPTKTLHLLLAEGLPLYFENQQGIIMPEKGMVINP